MGCCHPSRAYVAKVAEQKGGLCPPCMIQHLPASHSRGIQIPVPEHPAISTEPGPPITRAYAHVSLEIEDVAITQNVNLLHFSGEDTVPSLWYRPHP